MVGERESGTADGHNAEPGIDRTLRDSGGDSGGVLRAVGPVVICLVVIDAALLCRCTAAGKRRVLVRARIRPAYGKDYEGK